MILDYDNEADVLYVVFEETPGPCSYVENHLGDIIRVDKETKRIVGCTILFFSKRTTGETAIDIPEVGSVPLNGRAERLLSTGSC